jgi:hypothetical protein
MTQDGLLPSCWGPTLWWSLHSIAMAYDPKNKESYFSFFKNLGNVLPCEECKLHYSKNFNSDKLRNELETKEGLFKWVYDLHNTVNKQTGVPKSKWPTYEEIKKKFENFKVSCDSAPGVCGGAIQGKDKKKIIIVEEFGNTLDPNLDRIVSVVLGIVCISLIGYIYYIGCSQKKQRKK